ncbi:hypothetical protein EXIGLDRAFT_687798 [Exidia glandulosa HHB12029]|uniref:S-adenosyl-L-methionine-dependent methyltransferase n=1 Tax=Exidia glandulosa HHB12029 TaxID=1314781 RepID=A0A165B998_EXIGL|nr:hypothetical protein EXIGLDRAFT_687798 [Exidia glandulosa HHB12029]
MGWAFWPTLADIRARPSLLLRPLALRRVFFTHVWAVFGKGMDQGEKKVKAELVTPHAVGVVLEIGAGHGHTAHYLDRAKVTRYVPLEPNPRFHAHIREHAREAGFVEADGSLLILCNGAEDISGITHILGPSSVDTLLSIHSFCSVPNPKSTIRALVHDVLKPGGQLLSYEHIEGRTRSVRFAQAVLNPIWTMFFDGCNIGRPIFDWLRAADDWESSEEWGVEELDPDTLFDRRAGRFVRRT